ncbi:MAG: hypothetical protein LBQ75_08295, partial [Zoogloeaceae bacterium]|nr:hypothetical protein [Zoogloeaceae bacterium]
MSTPASKARPGAGGTLFLIAFALAIAGLQQQATLPATPLVWLVAGLSLAGMLCFLQGRVAYAFLLFAALVAGGMSGWGYAAWRAEGRLQNRLDT